jgi:hypothetical protein
VCSDGCGALMEGGDEEAMEVQQDASHTPLSICPCFQPRSLNPALSTPLSQPRRMRTRTMTTGQTRRSPSALSTPRATRTSFQRT